jgi:hypothetical protein
VTQPRMVKLVLLATLSLGLSCRSERDTDRLALRELWAVRIPDSTQVIGALPLTPDQVIVWSADRNVTSFWRGGEAWHATLPDSSAIVDVFWDDTQPLLHAIDAEGRRVFLLDSMGTVLRPVPLVFSQPGRVIEGGKLKAGIVLGVFDTLSSLYRVLLVSTGEARELWGVRTGASSIQDPPFHLSVVRDTVIIAQTRFPFDLLAVDTSGHVSTLSVGGLALPADSGPSSEMWRALRVVPLDHGAAQSQSLLSGDARRLMRYTSAWERAALSTLDVPFGIVSSRVATQTLVAARHAGGLEIVVYAWEWRARSRSATTTQ